MYDPKNGSSARSPQNELLKRNRQGRPVMEPKPLKPKKERTKTAYEKKINKKTLIKSSEKNIKESLLNFGTSKLPEGCFVQWNYQSSSNYGAAMIING